MKRNLISYFWLLALVLGVSCNKGDDSLAPNAEGTPVSQEVCNPLLIDAAKTELSGTDAGQVMKLFMYRESPVAATRSAFADKTVAETFPINGDDGQPLAYVVNYQGGGYGIVSATKKYAPILAFSDEGRITPAALEGNGLALWVASMTADIADAKAALSEDSPEYADTRLQWREYEKPEPVTAFSTTMQDANYWYLQLRTDMMGSVGFCTSNRQMFYSAASAFGVVYMDQARMEREFQEMDRVLKIEYGVMDAPPVLIWGEGLRFESQTKVMPLLKTYWHQFEPYNNYIEFMDSDPRYHKPAGCGPIAVAQIMNYYRHPSVVMGTPIDWTKTQGKFASGYDSEIGKLVKAVNAGLNSDNQDDGSSSSTNAAEDFLKACNYRVNQYGTDLDAFCSSEIQSRRPVFMRGDGAGGGHAWVCDGYYSKDSHYQILAYQLTSTEKRNFSENPYYKLLDRSRQSRNGIFYHMNWGWRTMVDESDPSTLRGDSDGWFRTVTNNSQDLNSNMKILTIIKN